MEQDRDESVVVVRRGGGQVAAAFLIGLAVGAGAALLFAPQSGAETRADIARQAKRARRAATRMAEEVRERASDAYATARREVRHRAADARRGVEDVIDDDKSRVEAGREAGKAATRAAREELHRRLAEAKADGNGEEGE
jgi:gas vesicle protein